MTKTLLETVKTGTNLKRTPSFWDKLVRARNKVKHSKRKSIPKQELIDLFEHLLECYLEEKEE